MERSGMERAESSANQNNCTEKSWFRTCGVHCFFVFWDFLRYLQIEKFQKVEKEKWATIGGCLYKLFLKKWSHFTHPETMSGDKYVGIPDALLAEAMTAIEEHMLPQKSRTRYNEYLQDFENWAASYQLPKESTDGKCMMAYFAFLKEKKKYQISTIISRFSTLKRSMVVKGKFLYFFSAKTNNFFRISCNSVVSCWYNTETVRKK